jgi:hypothetical protein
MSTTSLWTLTAAPSNAADRRICGVVTWVAGGCRESPRGCQVWGDRGVRGVVAEVSAALVFSHG